MRQYKKVCVFLYLYKKENVGDCCLCGNSVLVFMVEGDLTDQASCPRSSGSDPQTVISDTVVLSSGSVKVKVAHLSPHSPTFRYNPFNEDSDTNTTNTSADVTPVHVASRYYATTATGDDAESTNNELEVIRYSRYGVSYWFIFYLHS